MPKGKLFTLVFAILLILIHSGFVLHPFVNQSPYEVVILKSKYELYIYDREGWLATYPVVFGTSELNKKVREGDRGTPEGKYRITYKKKHNEWGYFLLLDYPNKEDLENFEALKKAGKIPSTARPGNGIGIHGTRKDEDRHIDHNYNWTLGCISTKRDYIRELYELLPTGTSVTIRP